jgi:hypothetical protein
MLQPHAPYCTRWQFVHHRYVPLGIIWSPGSYPTIAAGYDDKFATLRKWVLARLAWMEGQLKQVRGQRCRPRARVNAWIVGFPFPFSWAGRQRVWPLTRAKQQHNRCWH